MYQPRTFIKYSQAFKQKVVNEIENGKLGISEAHKIYSIQGKSTIQKWIKKLGKTHLLNKVIHIEMKGEKDKIKELELKKRELESALAQAHLKIITLESTIKVLEEESGVTLKKSIDGKSLKKVLKTKDSKKEDTK